MIGLDDALSEPLAVVWSSVTLSVVAARNVPIESAAAPERWIEPAASDAGPPANVQFVIASPAGPELYWNATLLPASDTGPIATLRLKLLPVVANHDALAVVNESRSRLPPVTSICAPPVPRCSVAPVTETVNSVPVTVPEVAAVALTLSCRTIEKVATPTEPSPVTVRPVAPPETRNVCASTAPMTPANDQSVTVDGL